MADHNYWDQARKAGPDDKVQCEECSIWIRVLPDVDGTVTSRMIQAILMKHKFNNCVFWKRNNNGKC